MKEGPEEGPGIGGGVDMQPFRFNQGQLTITQGVGEGAQTIASNMKGAAGE